MSYANTKAKDLFSGCHDRWKEVYAEPMCSACAWSESLNIEFVWQIVQEWFEYMQAGVSDQKYPDPFWQQKPGRKELTPDQADVIIMEMENDFLIERGRWPNNLGPEFSRLKPHARLAFAQRLYDAIMTIDEIKKQADDWLKAGVQEFPFFT